MMAGFKRVGLLFVFTIMTVGFLFAQKMNQFGFISNSVKRVYVAKELQNQKFAIINEKGKEFYKGVIGIGKYSEVSGDTVACVDFSFFKQEGNFSVKIGKTLIPFVINNKNYEQLGKDVTRYFYLERASTVIDAKYAGKYARPVGHLDDKVFVHASAASPARPEGTVISAPGGWYDAGDFNKYAVNSSVATYTLLHAMDVYKDELKKTEFNIPESGDEIPDLLQEALYNLNWLLLMQDPYDGSVYHKLTSKTFCGMKMPHTDKLPRFVVGKSTAAALDFASVMSKASRVLKSYECYYPGLSDKCLDAAKKAWDWAVKNPAMYYVQPKDVTTGEYKDFEIEDEWQWAAVEMFLATGEAKYEDYISFKDTLFTNSKWEFVGTFSLYSIVSDARADYKIKDKASRQLMRLANTYYKNYNDSAYNYSIQEFPWGSNGEVANQGMLYLHAYRLTNDKKYLEAADASLQYLLGANATGYSFITGYGYKTPKHIHERITIANGIEDPAPGFLCGGPTRLAMNDCGEANYPSTFPAKTYLDKECSYSTNEVAINWNSALVYLVLGLNSELNK